MTIEKTYKLTIKNWGSFFLSEEEVSALYEQCRKALNIKDLPTTNPVKPNIPYPYDTYPWYTPKYPNDTGTPYWTGPTTTCNTIPKTIPSGEGIPVMDFKGNTGAILKSTSNIHTTSDDMESIRENDKWRSSVQQALDKLSVKKNGTTTTNDMIWDHTHPKVDHNNGSLKFGT